MSKKHIQQGKWSILRGSLAAGILLVTAAVTITSLEPWNLSAARAEAPALALADGGVRAFPHFEIGKPTPSRELQVRRQFVVPIHETSAFAQMVNQLFINVPLTGQVRIDVAKNFYMFIDEGNWEDVVMNLANMLSSGSMTSALAPINSLAGITCLYLNSFLPRLTAASEAGSGAQVFPVFDGGPFFSNGGGVIGLSGSGDIGIRGGGGGGGGGSGRRGLITITFEATVDPPGSGSPSSASGSGSIP